MLQVPRTHTTSNYSLSSFCVAQTYSFQLSGRFKARSPNYAKKKTKDMKKRMIYTNTKPFLLKRALLSPLQKTRLPPSSRFQLPLLPRTPFPFPLLTRLSLEMPTRLSLLLFISLSSQFFSRLFFSSINIWLQSHIWRFLFMSFQLSFKDIWDRTINISTSENNASRRFYPFSIYMYRSRAFLFLHIYFPQVFIYIYTLRAARTLY